MHLTLQRLLVPDFDPFSINLISESETKEESMSQKVCDEWSDSFNFKICAL